MQADENEIKMEDPSAKPSCKSDSDSEDDASPADAAGGKHSLTSKMPKS